MARVPGLLLLLTSAVCGGLQAQSLPAYRPLNPAIAGRSALGFDPLTIAEPGWHTAVRLSYGNVLEAQTRLDADYLFDVELMRVELALGRTTGRWHLQGAIAVESAQSGALDPFINWWHGIFGFQEGRRDGRPINEYDYFIEFPDSTRYAPALPGTALGDLRLTASFLHRPGWQTTLVTVLPTNGYGSAWGLETVALGLETAIRATLIPDRLVYEGSGGVGFTPVAGDLARWQRTVMATASSGLRLRFWGRQAAYTNLFFHTGPWHSTTLDALGGPDFSIDFGFLFKAGDGPEILVGMVEDLYPYGPAVDLTLRLGLRWQ